MSEVPQPKSRQEQIELVDLFARHLTQPTHLRKTFIESAEECLRQNAITIYALQQELRFMLRLARIDEGMPETELSPLPTLASGAETPDTKLVNFLVEHLLNPCGNEYGTVRHVYIRLAEKALAEKKISEDTAIVFLEAALRVAKEAQAKEEANRKRKS